MDVVTCILALSVWVFTVVKSQEGDAIPLNDASCVDRCDESYIPGLHCYCNSACDQYENCCFDYYPVCLPDFVWSEEWMEFEGHTYKFFSDQTLSANEAIAACRLEGAMLVSINSPDEEDFIAQRVLRKRTLSTFIGATDILQEGRWVWADGQAVPMPGAGPWHGWYEGQPDDSDGTLNCAVATNYRFWAVRKIHLPEYYWLDYSCRVNALEIQGFVCERTLQCDPNPCDNNGTCLYVGGVEEYICECAQGYVGDHCEIQLRPDEIWTRCGETELRGDHGEISSPLYPKFYPPNVRCEWLIQVDQGKTISLSLESFDVEKVKDCAFDSLTLYDGSEKTDPILLGPVCGTEADNDTNVGKSLTSSGNSVLVAFNTDKSVHMKGFRLQYDEEKCGLGTGDSGCDTRREFLSNCGVIDIRQGPEVGSACEWLIGVQAGHVINITFFDFTLDDIGGRCDQGYLAVYDGSNSSATLLGQYCGERFPWSLQSRGQLLYLTLTTTGWNSSLHRVQLEYQAIDSSRWRVVNAAQDVEGIYGTVTSQVTPPHVFTVNTELRQWYIRVPVGDKIHVTWTLRASKPVSLKVYDGYSSFSGLLTDLNLPAPDRSRDYTDQIHGSNFRLLLLVNSTRDDSVFQFSATYDAYDWYPELSGCYRPLYMYRLDSSGTENKLVRPLEPAVIMTSKKSYDQTNPGYDPGLYCKWLVRGQAGLRLALQLLEARVQPITQRCDYDGIVIYDGNVTSSTAYGPYCGSRDLLTNPVEAEGDILMVVFYSDNRGATRPRGLMRAIVRAQDMGRCDLLHMGSATSRTLTSTCGVLLSPRFPGAVEPGLWTWFIEGPPDGVFVIYVYYVRGPGIKDNCEEFFRILEVSQDAAKLRQYESIMLQVCASQQLFAPPRRIKAPPGEKIAFELSTIKSPLQRRWEFKLSYQTEYMDKPDHLEAIGVSCPDQFLYYRGHCYHYHPWVHRHYEPDKYDFQATWQDALDQCRTEGATLLTIHDQDEADAIKYLMGVKPPQGWFWDPAGTWQTNHRLIFLGLHNKFGRYVWQDDTPLAYADWYRPAPAWAQQAVHEDTQDTELLGLGAPQPSADRGSLCTVLLAVSPHSSLNWAKIPCDYPIFMAGVICKRQALPKSPAGTVEEEPVSDIVRQELSKPRCPAGWIMTASRCFKLLTKHEVLDAGVEAPWKLKHNILTYPDALHMCHQVAGQVARVDQSLFSKLTSLLRIWNHERAMGDIWVSRDEGNSESICNMIQTYTLHDQDERVHFRLMDLSCDQADLYYPINVFCEIQWLYATNECRSHEFQCGDGTCVSRDHVCDDVSDCQDGTDEINCECDAGVFQCANGRCVSLSLFCDFIDHCGDNSDEQNCILEVCADDDFRCHNGECVPAAVTCDFRFDCQDGSDEHADTCESHCGGFLCFSGTCLRPELQDDLVSDCPGLAQEDEIKQDTEIKTMFNIWYFEEANDTSSSVLGCGSREHVQCQTDHPRCYPRSRACVYDTVLVDQGRDVTVQASCRNGGHVRTHCDVVECPGMFHCPDSYCLPLTKVCDGQPDCPRAQDEHGCHNYTCPGQFRCKGSTFCVPRDKVCDGEVNCLHGDDEKYCDDIDPTCVAPCRCEGWVLQCAGVGLDELAVGRPNTTRGLRGMMLANNRLTLNASSLLGLHWLSRLVLSNNSLQRLPLGGFRDLKNLLHLDLSRTRLSGVERASFLGLGSLRELDLSYNRLSRLRRDMLEELSALHRLVLEHNLLQDVSLDAFGGLPALRVLNSDAYKFCCIARQAQECTPAADEFSSCEDLMANYALQVAIWVLGWLAFAGNLFVIIWRVKSERQTVSSFFILNLGCSDFLMGVYMLVIASVDVFYRGRYIVYADAWRASVLCQAAGVLAMLSSELSVYMLTAITVDRCISILFPLKVGHFRLKHARIVVAVGWATCFFLSILPAFPISYFGGAFFGRTGVCLPFQVSNKKEAGWEYSAFIFLIVNLISFIAIFLGYVCIFVRVKTAMKEMGSNSTSTSNEYDLAKKLMLIVATDFLCWVPIILIGFAALGGAHIAPQVSAWIAVFILPLNSAVNPILYTISAIDCRSITGWRAKPSMSMSSTGGRTGVSNVAETSLASNTKVTTKVNNDQVKVNNEVNNTKSDSGPTSYENKAYDGEGRV